MIGVKGFLTYDEQITFLKEKKNLKIENEEYAKSILFKTGYFSLINGYKEIFKDSTSNQFQTGTMFEDIYELYQFDNDLRNIFIKYILIAERNIKSSLSYHFCHIYGDQQEDYLNMNHYNYTDKNETVIKKMLKIMSGQLSIIYSCQKGRVQTQICRDFGPIKVNELKKMLAVMTKFRNVCAHNDRLFDFRTKDALCDMKIHERLLLPKENGRFVYGKNDLFALLIILKLLLPEDEFKLLSHDLKVCFRKHPGHKAVFDKMGFPKEWRRIERIKKYTKGELK